MHHATVKFEKFGIFENEFWKIAWSSWFIDIISISLLDLEICVEVEIKLELEIKWSFVNDWIS